MQNLFAVKARRRLAPPSQTDAPVGTRLFSEREYEKMMTVKRSVTLALTAGALALLGACAPLPPPAPPCDACALAQQAQATANQALSLAQQALQRSQTMYQRSLVK